MAYFAELDDANVVLRVLVVANEYVPDGEQWCADNFGGRWLQTSYTGSFRGKFAGIGDIYDPALNVFVTPEQPENES